MKPSTKLKECRERSGLSPHDLAAVVGISSAEYYDLESSDDLETCLDLSHIKGLASLLGIRLAALFADTFPDDKTTPAELAVLVERMLSERRISLSEAEERIGWSLGPLLANPDSAILDWDITCLRDVCDALGSNWLAVLNAVEGGANPKGPRVNSQHNSA